MEKTKSKQFHQTFVVITEGETGNILIRELSVWYFDKKVNVKPRLPKNSSYQQIFKSAEQRLKQNDNITVIAVLDKDKVRGNQKYEQQKQKLLKRYKGRLIIIETNPCIEYLFLLSKVKTAKPFINCDEVIAELKKYWKDYDKGKKAAESFKRYLNFSEINKAILNAIQLFPNKQISRSYTQLHLLLVILAQSFDSKEELEQYLREHLTEARGYYVYWQQYGKYKLAFYSENNPRKNMERLKRQLLEIAGLEINLMYSRL